VESPCRVQRWRCNERLHKCLENSCRPVFACVRGAPFVPSERGNLSESESFRSPTKVSLPAPSGEPATGSRGCRPHPWHVARSRRKCVGDSQTLGPPFDPARPEPLAAHQAEGTHIVRTEGGRP
jgi:hypothetical protein